jgi:NADH-quinone oxidoreductase subunit G
MVKRAGAWAEVDWPEALEAAAQGLKDVVTRHGPQGLATLSRRTSRSRSCTSPRSSRAGSAARNWTIAFASRISARAPQGAPWLGMPIADADEAASRSCSSARRCARSSRSSPRACARREERASS